MDHHFFDGVLDLRSVKANLFVLPALNTCRTDSSDRCSIHLHPLWDSPRPLFSINLKQSNYGLSSEPSIVRLMRGSWAQNDGTTTVTLLIIVKLDTSGEKTGSLTNKYDTD